MIQSGWCLRTCKRCGGGRAGRGALLGKDLLPRRALRLGMLLGVQLPPHWRSCSQQPAHRARHASLPAPHAHRRPSCPSRSRLYRRSATKPVPGLHSTQAAVRRGVHVRRALLPQDLQPLLAGGVSAPAGGGTTRTALMYSEWQGVGGRRQGATLPLRLCYRAVLLYMVPLGRFGFEEEFVKLMHGSSCGRDRACAE